MFWPVVDEVLVEGAGGTGCCRYSGFLPSLLDDLRLRPDVVAGSDDPLRIVVLHETVPQTDVRIFVADRQLFCHLLSVPGLERVRQR